MVELKNSSSRGVKQQSPTHSIYTIAYSHVFSVVEAYWIIQCRLNAWARWAGARGPMLIYVHYVRHVF